MALIIFLLAIAVWITNNPEITEHYCQPNEPNNKYCTDRGSLVTIGVLLFNGLNFYSPAISALSGIAVAVFTVALAVSTRALWVETRKLAEGAEAQSADLKRSIEIAQVHAAAAATAAGADRAWMCYANLETNETTNGFLNGIPFQNGLMLSMNWINQGRSPAIGSVIRSELKVIAFHASAAPRFQIDWNDTQVGAPIGPGVAVGAPIQILTDQNYRRFCSERLPHACPA